MIFTHTIRVLIHFKDKIEKFKFKNKLIQNVIKGYERARNFLLSIAPKLRKIKDDIIKLTILKTIIRFSDEVGSLEDIRTFLKSTYKIKIDELFLKTYIEELSKKGYISKGILKGRIVYGAKKEAKSLIKSIEKRNEEIMEKVFNLIINKLPENLKEEALRLKKEITADFVVSFARAMNDEDYYNAILNRKIPIKKLTLEPKLRKGSKELKKRLTEIYKQIYTDDPEVFERLFNISLFWNSFSRISSLEKETRKLLIEEMKKTQIIADTNTIIAYCCHLHPEHDRTYDYYNFLRKLGIKILYTEQTKKELERHLKIIGKIVKTLQFYRERAHVVARETNEHILQAFFFENYLSWKEYERDFWEKVEENFEYLGEEDIEKLEVNIEDLKKMVEKILPDVEKYMNKKGEIAIHDAYLIALVRLLRDARSKTDWFKYIDWVSTHDYFFKAFDEFVGEKKDPVSLLVRFIPLYFHPYSIAAAIEGGELSLEAVYDLIYYSSYKLQDNYEDLRSTVEDIYNVKTRDEFTEKLLKYTQILLSDSGGLEGG